MSFSVSTGLTLSHSRPLGWASTTADGSPDTALRRDAANTLGQRNGVNAQTYNLYNTADTNLTNYERAHIGWNDTADTFVIGTEAAGAGVLRNLGLSAPAIIFNQEADFTQYTTSGLRFVGFDDVSNYWTQIGVGSNGRGYIQSNSNYIHTSSLLPEGVSRSGQLGGDTNYWGSVWSARSEISQGTLTDDAQALNITSTWNDAADTFTLIKADVTDTASAAGSNLLDLQVGGASKFSVGSDGNVVTTGSILKPTQATDYLDVAFGTSDYNSGITCWSNTKVSVVANNVGVATFSPLTGLGVMLKSDLPLSWGNVNINGSADLALYRDAANTLAQRNGVNAQTHRLYNFYTNATDYERAHIGWNDTADTFVIGTEAAGTGVVRPFQLKGNVGIGKIPDAGYALDVGGEGRCTTFRVSGGYFSGNVLELKDATSVRFSNYFAAPILITQGPSVTELARFDASGLELVDSIGLHGVTPPAQAAHIADATDATDVITRVNAILVALENIGITASV